jgi:hypothetical protein
MVCLMYAAFKIIDPTADIGFDLANEYALADQMKRDPLDLVAAEIPDARPIAPGNAHLDDPGTNQA